MRLSRCCGRSMNGRRAHGRAPLTTASSTMIGSAGESCTHYWGCTTHAIGGLGTTGFPFGAILLKPVDGKSLDCSLWWSGGDWVGVGIWSYCVSKVTQLVTQWFVASGQPYLLLHNGQ